MLPNANCLKCGKEVERMSDEWLMGTHGQCYTCSKKNPKNAYRACEKCGERFNPRDPRFNHKTNVCKRCASHERLLGEPDANGVYFESDVNPD
jgi:predicted nucleic acid-binding Zn ribbon protein